MAALADKGVDPDFWRGRRVAVTGHSGFKGAWLSLWLARMGAEVTGIGGLAAERSLFRLAGVDADVRTIEADVRDFERVRDAVATARPEVLIHMAAQPLVRRSFEAPRETYEINVMGTVNVLEAVRLADGVRAVVNVTSDKCYENRDWEWGYREYEPMGGHDPYSNSKGCSELVTAAFRSSFFALDPDGPRLASARAGNVIGGGDWGADRLVPDIMRAALEGEPLVIRNPDSIRPWQHVLSALSGYLVLAQTLWDSQEAASGWNFGPEDADARPVSWILERVAALWPGRLSWAIADGAQPHEAHYLKLDSSRARLYLGWEPRWDLEQALERIIDWYRAFADGADMRALSAAQIDEFMRAGSAAGAPGGELRADGRT